MTAPLYLQRVCGRIASSGCKARMRPDRGLALAAVASGRPRDLWAPLGAASLDGLHEGGHLNDGLALSRPRNWSGGSSSTSSTIATSLALVTPHRSAISP